MSACATEKEREGGRRGQKVKQRREGGREKGGVRERFQAVVIV